MNSTLLANGVRRTIGQIRYVSPVLPGAADGLVASVYAQAERDFGIVAPPLVLHSPSPASLAAIWLMLRETLLAVGEAGRAEKEVVAAAVSAENQCPYCVAVHSAAARDLTGESIAASISSGQLAEIADPKLRDLARWARETGKSGPVPPPPGSARGFPEIAGVAVTFHYLNRMVSVFLPESPLPPLTPKPMASWVMGMLAAVMVAPRAVPGASLDLLPEAPLPAEFSWAAGTQHVAGALARADAAAAEAGRRLVPEPVRDLVLGQLEDWDGRPPGPSRAWAEELAARLSAGDRSSGRLALLTALAPYQVTKRDIGEFRDSGRPGDEGLIALTSWASMAAACRAGSQLRLPS
jgi:AhpD family alkylhydroperoxidase